MIRVQVWREGAAEPIEEIDCPNEEAANRIIDAGATALWEAKHGAGLYSIIAFRMSGNGLYQSVYWQAPEPGIRVA